MQRRIVVLDIGTIVTGYDSTHELDNGKFPAIIDKELAGIFDIFSEAGYFILISTGNNDNNTDYYQGEFVKAGIHEFVKAYSPDEYANSKMDKLQQYARQSYLLDDKQYV